MTDFRLSGTTGFLEDVEEILSSLFASNVTVFDDISRYVIDSGGKRVRPLLLGLASNLGEPDSRTAAVAAAAIETIHTASLIHDDVVDATTRRRGRETVHMKWGQQAAVAAADYLFAKSFVVIGSVDKSGMLIRILSDAVVSLSEGEILQQQAIDKQAYDEDLYFLRVQKKTASLFEASCHMGAVIGGLDETEISKLKTYGRNLGIAFQVLDDILDIVGVESATGKRIGTDIIDRVPTLPTIKALDSTPKLLGMFLAENKSMDNVEEIISLVQKSGGIEAARDIGLNMVDRANEAISDFDKEPWISHLRKLAAFVLERYY